MSKKEISYNNLVDIGAAIDLINELQKLTRQGASADAVFAIIKYTNVVEVHWGYGKKKHGILHWQENPESAFGRRIGM